LIADKTNLGIIEHIATNRRWGYS